jgi:hypothetical protein
MTVLTEGMSDPDKSHRNSSPQPNEFQLGTSLGLCEICF